MNEAVIPAGAVTYDVSIDYADGEEIMVPWSYFGKDNQPLVILIEMDGVEFEVKIGTISCRLEDGILNVSLDLINSFYDAEELELVLTYGVGEEPCLPVTGGQFEVEWADPLLINIGWEFAFIE